MTAHSVRERVGLGQILTNHAEETLLNSHMSNEATQLKDEQGEDVS